MTAMHPSKENPFLLEAALSLHGLGWAVIPLCHPAHDGHHPPTHKKTCKKPGKHSVRKYKTTPGEGMTANAIHQAWAQNPKYNVGVVTGRISGIVMIDLDSPQGEATWEGFDQGRCPPTWEFSTGKGRRLVFAWTYTDVPDDSPFVGLEAHISFLGEGQMSVMPPSLHKSGVRYQWTRGGPGSGVQLADFPDELVAQVSGKADAKKRSPGGGISKPHHAAKGQGPEPRQAPEPQTPIARCKAYLAKMGPPDSTPEHPMDATLHLLKGANACVGFDLQDDIAAVLLAEWDSRNPGGPFPQSEYRRKLVEARKTGHVAPGALLNGKGTHHSPPPPPRKDEEPRVCVPPPPIYVKQDAPPPPTRPGIFGVPIASLKREKRRWLFEPWIYRGTLTGLTGRPGAGKSSFLAFLCKHARKSLYLLGEGDADSLEQRLEAHGVDPASVPTVELEHGMRFPDNMKELEQSITAHRAELVVADPLSLFFSAGLKENINEDVDSVLVPLAQVAKRTGAAIVCIRHPGKAQGNDLRGAASWEERFLTVVKLTLDWGPPERRTISHIKNNAGPFAPTTYYTLERHGDGAPTFRLGEPVNPADAKLADEVPDRVERAKIDEAAEFLRGFLAVAEQEAAAVYKQGELYRYSDRTLRRAADRIGVITRREGQGREHKCWWSLPAAEPVQSEGGGV